MMYPDYQRVDNPEARATFEKLWGTQARPQAGPHRGRDHGRRARAARSRGMYIMGENPAMSRSRRAPCARRRSPSSTCLVVQDIFLTETGVSRRRDPAGVGVPGEDRHRSPTPTAWCSSDAQALEMPGDARQDLWIIQRDRAPPRPRLELRGDPRRGVRRDAPGDAVDRRHHVGAAGGASRRSPIRASTRAIPASRVVFIENFPTPTGRARLRAGGHHSRRRAARRRISRSCSSPAASSSTGTPAA